ncbi:hypothetical protein, partial [Klebsiella pneumoniae]|uniref:hypothetical protein n=1 Tax=Klebsiella pneumoniae TaxID=573 RepID=UPI001BE0D45D
SHPSIGGWPSIPTVNFALFWASLGPSRLFSAFQARFKSKFDDSSAKTTVIQFSMFLEFFEMKMH